MAVFYTPVCIAQFSPRKGEGKEGIFFCFAACVITAKEDHPPYRSLSPPFDKGETVSQSFAMRNRILSIGQLPYYMMIIADSGATKTDWCLGHTKTDCRIVQTGGINPFHQTIDEIGQLIASTLVPQLGDTTEFTAIYFYGAGCIPEKAELVKQALLQSFPQANVSVESDLLGAAHALCGKSAGIACILGTGSNSCAYDGEKITDHISPLGYMLGDEGSGAVLGKRLVSDCLKHQLPEDLCRKFLQEYKLTPALILDKVYRQPLANRFLASLTPFLLANKHRSEIHSLLISCFADFFRRNVMQYSYRGVDIHFTGSIAYYFQDELKEAAQALDIATGIILKSPMKGLMDYHYPV